MTIEKQKYYTPEDIARLDLTRIPSHVAFIPDGNRRWAKNQQLKAEEGHREGSDNLIDIVKAGKEVGINTFTFYLFSTENWNRAQEEIDALMWLLHTYLIEQLPTFLEEGTKLCTIGDLSALPDFVKKTIEDTKKATAHCDEVDLIFALNYGSRDEIKRAIKKIAYKVSNQELSPDQISEELIAEHLDTAKWKDPELLIRTSGELRVSNYLLWQISYSELYACDVLWPDFTPRHLLDALMNFQSRERRGGK